MEERALLIEWKSDGSRAGGINPKDPKLQCYGWQNMDVFPMIELRIVEDDRDLSQLSGVSGVTIIEGKESINNAIDYNFPPRYYIQDEFIYQEHFKQKNKTPETSIIIDELPIDMQDRLKELMDTYNLNGIAKKDHKHI